MQTTVFDTKPLLRPAQVEKTKEEIASLRAKLESPHIEDKGEVAKQLRRVSASFEAQVPRAPESVEEEGRMVARSNQLLREWTQGMCSQEEMRKCPPGAVDKHMAWEKRNKKKIEEWKNLQLRLKPGESEAASIERHRPVGSSLNMDNAVIPGKQFFFGPLDAGIPVVFSAEQLAYLRSVSPELADQVGLMGNEQRRQVKQVLDGGIGLAPEASESTQAQIDGKRGAEKREAMKKAKKAGRRKMSDEARKAAGDRLRKMHADRKAAQVAG